jgi:hypothetical protein
MEMKKEALITAMKNSISEVLETMFFLPLDFLIMNLWKDYGIWGKITFCQQS